MTSIAERFLLVRGKIKQGDFAKSLGINPNTLRNYENGRVLPNQEILERICVQFSVSPRWLLLGKGPMLENCDTNSKTAPILTEHLGGAQFTKQSQELELSHFLAKLEKVESQRDELFGENRELHKENSALLRENGELREKVARLEERKRRYELTHGFPAESSKVGS